MSHELELHQVEGCLGYVFKNKDLLSTALTHRSWVEEQYPGGSAPSHLSNQRLEFLGDSFINYVVGRWLYEKLPMTAEGELTLRRAALVKGQSLHDHAIRLGLRGEFLRLGRGETAKMATNKILLGDAMEAIVGAILLDGGPELATAFVLKLLPPKPPEQGVGKDPIIALGEWYQKTYKQSLEEPSYDWDGPDHARIWTCTVEVAGQKSEASSQDKRNAKRMAYARMLTLLGIPGFEEG